METEKKMANMLRRLYEWTEAVRVISIWIAICIGMLLAIVSIVAFPAVMCANYSWWWLLGYVGYAAVMYFLYELFVR